MWNESSGRAPWWRDPEVTFGECLAQSAETLAAAGLTGPRREAAALIRQVVGRDPLLFATDPLDPRSASLVAQAVDRRARREPLAYITGHKEFRDLDLEVNQDVLIPRPETETLVEVALASAPSARLVADIGTGCGAIGLSVLSALPSARLDATDLSPLALAVAARNATRHHLAERCRWFRGDLWDALPAESRGRYDLVVSNPPYVTWTEWDTLAPEIQAWEPKGAFVAEEGWESLARRLVAGSRGWLKPGGLLLLEIGGQTQADGVLALLSAAGFTDRRAEPDLAGRMRVVGGRWPW